MGEAKKRKKEVGFCIYCGSTEELTDEHVLPYGLGGELLLPKSSCNACAKETGRLEQRLLRGHWWPYRKKLGLQTRHPRAQERDFPVTILKSDGTRISGQMPLESFVAAMVFFFPPPSVLGGKARADVPFAESVSFKMLGPSPTEAKVDGCRYLLSPFDRVEYPVDFDAADLARFLAKVAHGYAVSKMGTERFSSMFLPEFILGRVEGLLTYVGGFSTSLALPVLPGGGINRMMVLPRGDMISVCIQLFVDKGDPPPIYEVVVGRLAP